MELFVISLIVSASIFVIGYVRLKDWVKAFDDVREAEISRLAEKLSYIYQDIETLKQEVAELKETPRDVTEEIHSQINEAREKVFTEWIQSIASYDPYNGGK